jgi:hypothetical protein
MDSKPATEMVGTLMISVPAALIETYVCPYCKSLDVDEFVEPHPVIASVKSVELDKVDEWIGQGYAVKELYAKTATMVKKEASKE